MCDLVEDGDVETDKVGFGRFAHHASGSTTRLHQSQCDTEDITDFCCSKWTTILTHFGTELSHFHRPATPTRSSNDHVICCGARIRYGACADSSLHGVPYNAYFEGVAVLHYLLGTVPGSDRAPSRPTFRFRMNRPISKSDFEQIRLISLSNCGEAKSRAFDLAFLLSRLGLLRYCKRLLDKTANCFRTGQLSILAPHPSIQSGKLGRL
jgi:hypothetical protein